MRTIKELVTILRDHVVKNGVHTGLCGCVMRLSDMGIIGFDEHKTLWLWIEDHKPTSGKYFDEKWRNVPIWESDNYFWPLGESAPRIAWLNDMLEEM